MPENVDENSLNSVYLENIRYAATEMQKVSKLFFKNFNKINLGLLGEFDCFDRADKSIFVSTLFSGLL